MPGCLPRQQLSRYLAGELSDADSEHLEGHVETCAACQENLAQLTEAQDLTPLWSQDTAHALSPRLRELRDTPPLSLGDDSSLDSSRDRQGPLPEIPGYDILRELGRGGKGVVYLACEQRPRRLVAIKMILHRAQASADDLLRFRGEAQALAALNHPNLVPVHRVDEFAGMPYFVMEYLPGGSLRQHIAGRRLSHAEAVAIMLRLADAMAAVHAAGFVHRDLKPDNVLMAGNGEPKVSDFGLARQAGWSDERITQTGAVLGTPLYMSPEQAAGRGPEVGPAADVYSLGAILYELLTGVRPIQGSGMMELLAELLLREPVAPRRLVPSIPRDLETVCLACLYKEPARRYPTAQALADDLRRFLADRPILARPPSKVYQASMFARRHKALVGGISATVAAVALGVTSTILFAIGEARQRGIAERNAQAAIAGKREAEFQAERARQQSIRAEDSARLAQAEKREAALQGYRARLAAAVLALSANDVADARRNLDECPVELRAWEWRHLYSQLDESASSAPSPLGPGTFLLGNPDRLQLADFTEAGLTVVDLESGKRKTLPIGPNRGQCATVAQTRLGLRIAIWVKPTAFELLDETGRVVCHVETPRIRKAERVVVSPDGKWLASPWQDGPWNRLAVYDASSGKQTAVCEGHQGDVLGCVFSPDGTQLATASMDTTVRLWDPVTGSQIATCNGHTNRVIGVAFRSDGQRLVSASSDGTVRQWDAATGQEIETAYNRHTGGVAVANYSPCGRWIASVGFDRTVRVWWAAGRQDIAVLHGHTGPVVRLAIDPAGRRLATLSNSWIFSPGTATAAVWDVDPESPLPALTGHGGPVNSLAYSPDGRWIATGSSDKTVRLWDAATGQCCAALPHPGVVPSLAFGPDGKWLATVNHGDDKLRIWDVGTARVRKEIQGPVSDFRHLIVSSDGWRVAATVFEDRKHLFQVCDVSTGEWLFSSEGMVLAYSPDGRWLAVQSVSDKAVLLLDARSHETMARFEGHTATVYGAAFSPDSRLLATGSMDHTVRLWQIDSGQCRVLRGHRNEVLAVAFHPDGTRLATAGRDQSVWLWDLERGEDVVRLPGHKSFVGALAFSVDGATLASGSGDTTIRLWDTAPLRWRYQERRDAEAMRPEAERLVAQRLSEDEAADVATQLQADDSLNPVLRRAALRALMCQGSQ